MRVVRSNDRRTTTTPNGTMTTLASPTLGDASRSMWTVEMSAGAIGPEHAFADEVIWTITSGACRVTCDDEAVELMGGDTVILPAGRMRRFVAGSDGFTAVVTTSAPGTVTRDDGTVVGTPKWVG